MMRLRLTALILCLSCAPAHAGGSLGLDEVLAAVAGEPKLVAEIQSELGKNNLKAADVICTGGRFGNQWKYLGGGRAAPYECDIGKRAIEIEADQTFFDSKGKSLGNLEKASPNRARTFKESNFRWSWTP